MIGPNELHDFFLHYVVRKGMGPTKIAFLAWKAWGNDKLGEWPVGFPESERRAYDFATIRKWLEVFITRFFETSQFKRSCLRSEEHTSELQSLMRISSALFCLKKKN